MIRDDTMRDAFARLADALADEILNASDAELHEAVPGYGGRVAADRWRQRVRRIGMSVDKMAEPAAAPVGSDDVDVTTEETRHDGR